MTGFLSRLGRNRKQRTHIWSAVVVAAGTASRMEGIDKILTTLGDLPVLVHTLREMGLSCFEPYGAFYIFPSIQEFGMTSEEFATRFLMEEKVAVISGAAFGPGGEGFIRCCYATSMKDIAEALTRMDNFLTNLRKKQAREG